MLYFEQWWNIFMSCDVMIYAQVTVDALNDARECQEILSSTKEAEGWVKKTLWIKGECCDIHPQEKFLSAMQTCNTRS